VLLFAPWSSAKPTATASTAPSMTVWVGIAGVPPELFVG